MNEGMFTQIDFGPLRQYLEDDDITDISYSNGGQLWLKTLSKGLSPATESVEPTKVRSAEKTAAEKIYLCDYR